MQRLFRIELQEGGRDGAFDDGALLLFRGEELRGALRAGEKVLALLGGDEGRQRLDAARDRQEIVGARRQHGVDQVVAGAHVAQVHLEAIMEEGEEVRVPDDRQQRQAGVLFQQHADDAEGGAAQRIGVLRAGRLLVDGPEADQRVELVGERHGEADLAGRHAVRRALRLVVVLDGLGDGGVLALEGGVFAAHDALELGEFADGLRAQVSLGEHHGAVDERGIGAGDLRQFSGERADARDALALRAELGVEGHVERIELGHALVERLCKVEAELFGGCLQRVEVRQVALVAQPEMLGVGKARTHDLAVAVHDLLAAVLRLDVGDEDEVVGKRIGARPACDEALLVRLDGEADDLGGDRQELFLEGAEQDLRPFDEAGHFIQQAFVLDQFEAVGEGDVVSVGGDDLLAPLGVQHDLRLFEACGVVGKAPHGDGLRRMETMAVGDIAGDKPVDLEGHDARFLGLRAEGAQDRLQRAHPAHGAGPCRSGAPAHGFRPGEIADDARHRLGNDLLGGTAGLDDMGDVEIALLRIRMDMRLGNRGKPCAAQEAFDRLLVGVGARALALLADIGRAGVEAADIERQAARRPVFARALVGQARFHQRVGDEFLQVARRLALHAGGNFLGAEFKQKIGHVNFPHPRHAARVGTACRYGVKIVCLC